MRCLFVFDLSRDVILFDYVYFCRSLKGVCLSGIWSFKRNLYSFLDQKRPTRAPRVREIKEIVQKTLCGHV